MKKFIGILATLLTMAFVAIVILRIWDIHLVSLDDVIKSSLTLALLAVLIIVLLIVYGFFFKGNQTRYNKEGGNRAQPKL